MLKTAAKNKPSLFLVYILRVLVVNVQTFASLYLSKLIIDEIVGARVLESIIFYAVLTIGINAVSYLVMNICDSFKTMYQEWFDEYFQREIAEESLTMDYEHTEDPEMLDRLNKAKEGMSWYSGGVVGILNCVQLIVENAIKLMGVVWIIATGCIWLLPVQIIALVIISFFNAKSNKIENKFYMRMAKINRVFGYYFFELSDFRFGKDIRLYKSKKMLLDKANSENDKLLENQREMANAQLKMNEGITVVNTVRDAISYFYIGYLAITKTISIGDFSLYNGSGSIFFWSLDGIISNLQEVVKRCNYAYSFIDFIKRPAAMEKGTEGIVDGDHEIEFRNVSFKYPRTEKYVLKNLSLKIKSGEHLSIVGLNGAGKTTFIKLLCRLYDVNDGEILIDGRNIKRYSDEEYRKLFSVVFQDFEIFAFPLCENIVLKNGEAATADNEKLTKAIRLTGLEEDVKKLENGVNTIISKSYDEKGTDLSGGQRQKVAISRALYKNAPIVILDEPTAALDPVAEYEIYNHFNSLVGGKTAIYISHRLSSCKFCDKIAVFAGDTVAEYGTHSELVKKEGGIYAEMFAAQAQYYA